MSEWVYRIVNRDGEWVKGDGYPGRKWGPLTEVLPEKAARTILEGAE